tara:strand:- start:1997 stop:2188 length:192 start_codon:yes stop_codon:yes gene_type:complete
MSNFLLSKSNQTVSINEFNYVVSFTNDLGKDYFVYQLTKKVKQFEDYFQDKEFIENLYKLENE